MKKTELMPKALQYMDNIWLYSFEHFGLVKADDYVGHLSDIFDVLANHKLGVSRPDLGENIFSLPIERHIIFFIPNTDVVTIIRVLNQSQNVTRHMPWH